VLALLLPVGVVSDTLLAASRGWRTMRPTVVIDRILRPGAQVLLLAGFALAAIGSPPAYTLGWAVPYLGSALLAGYVLHRLLQIYHPVHPKPRPYGRPRQSTVDRRRFWGFTGPRALASVAQLAAQRVDVLLLASLAGLRAAAVYAVAGRFIVLGQFANQAISQAVQPRLAELSAGEDRHGAAALYKTATGWLVLAAWPLYLGIAVYPPVYLGLFGPGFAGAHRVVVVLALAMLVATGCGMVDMVLSMAGRTSWNLANVVTALGVNLGVDLLLIPHLGALGAAIGLAAATLTNNLVPLAQIAIVLRLHPFGRGTLTAATLALACFGAIPLLVRVVAGPGILSAAASGMLGLAAYLTGAYHLRKTLALDAFLTLRAPMKRSKR
jgi:O-antigen/teichoic acid export membrane protein